MAGWRSAPAPFWEGDGEAYTIAGNIGLPLGENGFANLSAEFGASNPTSRSVQRADAAALIAAGNMHVRNPAQISGAPTVNDDLKLWGNFGRFLGDGVLDGSAGCPVVRITNWVPDPVTLGRVFDDPNSARSRPAST